MSKLIRPTFSIPESMSNTMGEMKVGQRMNVIINARVIEKTKSFTILRVDYVFLRPSRRTF